MEPNLKETQEKCESCNGKGWGVWSCCTGEPVNRDIMMCPQCKEHLGEEDCYDCDGTGYVKNNYQNYQHSEDSESRYWKNVTTCAERFAHSDSSDDPDY